MRLLGHLMHYNLGVCTTIPDNRFVQNIEIGLHMKNSIYWHQRECVLPAAIKLPVIIIPPTHPLPPSDFTTHMTYTSQEFIFTYMHA